jgi:hypothetical protein
MLSTFMFSVSAGSTTSAGSTCYDLKAAYQGSACCGANLQQATDYVVGMAPPPPMGMDGVNMCAGTKPTSGFDNTNCTSDGFTSLVAEQAGANVTAGYVGEIETTRGTPITDPYYTQGLCPVNVHWHLGAEHLSVGEYDEYGFGPMDPHASNRDGFGRRGRRAAANPVRLGFQCHHYDAADPIYTTPYDWKFCDASMQVGQTYEVHWPHSKAGACGTPYQYQTPFYDGVFCHFNEAYAAAGSPSLYDFIPASVGVQSQVFTIVNDESYYYPDLFRGMIMDGDFGADIAKYTGSTTGTSRDNTICSQYTPITWQVDRKCHIISASSFDKMCQDMLTQRDDMSHDLHAHGARELVADHLAANNLQRARD